MGQVEGKPATMIKEEVESLPKRVLSRHNAVLGVVDAGSCKLSAAVAERLLLTVRAPHDADTLAITVRGDRGMAVLARTRQESVLALPGAKNLPAATLCHPFRPQAALSKLALFGRLGQITLRKLAGAMREQKVSAGCIMIQHGAAGPAASQMYVVKSGKFEVRAGCALCLFCAISSSAKTPGYPGL